MASTTPKKAPSTRARAPAAAPPARNPDGPAPHATAPAPYANAPGPYPNAPQAPELPTMQPVWVRQEWTQAMTIAVAFAAAGIIGGVFLPLLTVNAHGDIDQLPGKQDLDHARLMLTLQVGVAMAAAALAAFAAPRARAMTVGMAALGAVPLAVFAVSAFRDYGRFLSGVGMIWVYFVLGGAAGIAAIVLTAVGAGTLKPQLLGAAVGIVSGWAIAWGLAAGWLLLNLQGEADKAAAANQDSPAITVAALAAVLLLGAAARRRRA